MNTYTYNKPAGIYPEEHIGRYRCDMPGCNQYGAWKEISGPNHQQVLRWLCSAHTLKYADFLGMSLAQVRNFAEAHPEHVAAQNALRELERQSKAAEKSQRYAKKHAIRNGMTKSRWSPSGPRCPTKRELR